MQVLRQLVRLDFGDDPSSVDIRDVLREETRVLGKNLKGGNARTGCRRWKRAYRNAGRWLMKAGLLDTEFAPTSGRRCRRVRCDLGVLRVLAPMRLAIRRGRGWFLCRI